MKRPLSLLLIVLLLASCSEGFTSFPVTEDAQEKVARDVTIIRLDGSNIASFSKPQQTPLPTTLVSGPSWEYRIGVGDVLSIVVFDHPELTLPAGDAQSGFLVQADGTFFYPFIGQITALGRNVADIRAELAERLSEYIPDPQVVVRIAAFNSQKVVITGEVQNPNTQALTTTPLTLLQAVNGAGGMSEGADPQRISIQRRGQLHNVDLDGFLTAGIRRNNPVMIAGDVVSVPRRRAEEAFILGQVQKPAAVDLSREPVTLTQALTRQGGLDELRADARGVFVFRASGEGMTVFQLETSSPQGLVLGTRFVLEPRDVVYITRSPLQKWNDTITALLPSVRSVPAVEAVVN